MKLGWLLVAVGLSLNAAPGCIKPKPPVVLAPASDELKALRLHLEGSGDRLGPETTTALEHALTKAGYVVTRDASQPHDVSLKVAASGEEVQSVMQTYVNGELQRTFHVTGTLTVTEGDTTVTTIPVDFECANMVVADADVNGLANALSRAPMFVALARRLKFDRELAAHKDDAPVGSASAAPSAPPPKK
jgi:outer membrane lipopolysaccharide assembly protein LptE/RlpB